MDRNSVWVGPESNLTPIEDLLGPVMYEFPSLPDEMVVFYAMQVAKDMVDRTGGIIEDHDLTLYCGVTDYLVPQSECFAHVAVVSITDGGYDMRYRIDEVSGHIIFPAVARTRVVQVTTKNTLDPLSCELPTWISTEGLDTLFDGVKAKLYELESIGKTDMNKAQYFQDKYDRAIRRIAALRAYKGKADPLQVNFGRVI